MEYKDLNELIGSSMSSRSFFISLPVEIQIRLHGRNDEIKSAYQLHKAVYADSDTERLHMLSRLPLFKKEDNDRS